MQKPPSDQERRERNLLDLSGLGFGDLQLQALPLESEGVLSFLGGSFKGFIMGC